MTPHPEQHGPADGLSLLDQLAAPTRDSLLATGHRRRFSGGEVVFHEGDPGDSCHVVARGLFVARSYSSLGDVLIVNLFSPGEVFGELALLGEDARRSATVSCVTAGETLTIPKDRFDEARRTDPGMDRFLVHVLADRTRRLTEQLVELRSVPADQRVLRRLLAYGKVRGRGVAVEDTDGEPTQGEVRITQEDLAHLAGTTRATVNRVLRRAADDGLVRLGRGRVQLLDVSAITRRAAV